MATLDDILTLARAGFNAEQIGALLQPAQAPAPQPEAQPAQEAAPQPEAQPAQEAAPQPDPYQQLMQELGAIKAQIQQSNRSQAQQPEAQQLTGDQILANIIAPPKRSS
jgi:hypothetical protein